MNPYSLKDLAERLNAKALILNHHNPALYIDGVGTIQDGQAGEIGFLAESHYQKYAAQTGLTALIVKEPIESQAHLLIVDDVKSAWRQVLLHFEPALPEAVISEHAFIAADAELGQGVSVGAGAVIESGAVIGDGCRIAAGAIIARGVRIGRDSRIGAGVKILEKSRIGERAEIAAGAVIGSRGFGLHFEQQRWHSLPQLGGVMIGDDVEIGACTTIDCGAVRDTIIEDGVKLDNHIQVGHNVHIGAHTVIAGCCVIAGSVKFGRYCIVGGACVFAGHIEIADGVHFTGHSSISKSITEKGVYSSGFPAVADREWKRFVASLKRLVKNQA